MPSGTPMTARSLPVCRQRRRAARTCCLVLGLAQQQREGREREGERRELVCSYSGQLAQPASNSQVTLRAQEPDTGCNQPTAQQVVCVQKRLSKHEHGGGKAQALGATASRWPAHRSSQNRHSLSAQVGAHAGTCNVPTANVCPGERTSVATPCSSATSKLGERERLMATTRLRLAARDPSAPLVGRLQRRSETNYQGAAAAVNLSMALAADGVDVCRMMADNG